MDSAAGNEQDAVTAETAAAGQTVSAAAASEALLSAASQGHYHAAQHLLAHHGLRPSSSTPGGWTALHAAAMAGHLQLLQLLVKHGAPVNACNNQSVTPLHSASRAGHKGSVDLLLASGAEVNAADQQGWTPLLLAIVGGHVEVVEVLLQHGANPNCAPPAGERGRTALHFATFVSTDLGRLQQLPTADWSDIDRDKLYIGKYAASDTEMLQLLLASGADASAKDDLYEWRPLHYAAFSGSLQAMELLLHNGADVDAVSCYGATALHAAAAAGWEEIVKLLLSMGADVNARYPKNPKHSALALAATHGHIQVMGVLIARGADVNALISPGRGLLSCPAQYGQVGAVKLLLRKGAGRGGEQLSQAARIAAAQGHKTVWAVLIRHALMSHPPEVFDSCLQGRQLGDAVRAMGRAWQEDVSRIEQQQAELERERADAMEMKKCAQQLIVQGVMLQRGGGQHGGHAKGHSRGQETFGAESSDWARLSSSTSGRGCR